VKKKNLRKIPDAVLAKISKLTDVDDVVVACVKRLAPEDVQNYAHLKLRVDHDGIVIPPPAPPPGNRGKYSDANINGREEIRKDLPKTTKSVVIQAQNWRGSGTHDVWQTREVYVRDLLSPKQVNLSIEVLQSGIDGSMFTLKFAVDEVLNRKASGFESELLYNLNILQENVGAADVYPSAATLAQYMETIRLGWQILPPGNLDDMIRRMLGGKQGAISQEQEETMRERLAVMDRLKPGKYIAGTSEFLRYFGAMFEDDFVVFENVQYGNALYVMFENWEALSRRSRIDLLKGERDGFKRILHGEGWADKLKALLREHRRLKAKK